MKKRKTPGMLNLQADRALDPDRQPGWRQKEDQLSCWLSSGSSGSPGGRKMKHEAAHDQNLTAH